MDRHNIGCVCFIVLDDATFSLSGNTIVEKRTSPVRSHLGGKPPPLLMSALPLCIASGGELVAGLRLGLKEMVILVGLINQKHA